MNNDSGENLAGIWQNMKNWPESHEFVGIRRTRFSDAMFPARFALLQRVYTLKRSEKREKKKNQTNKQKPARFCRIPTRFWRNHYS
jgi:hypothetical protein